MIVKVKKKHTDEKLSRFLSKRIMTKGMLDNVTCSVFVVKEV